MAQKWAEVDRKWAEVDRKWTEVGPAQKWTEVNRLGPTSSPLPAHFVRLSPDPPASTPYLEDLRCLTCIRTDMHTVRGNFLDGRAGDTQATHI